MENHPSRNQKWNSPTNHIDFPPRYLVYLNLLDFVDFVVAHPIVAVKTNRPVPGTKWKVGGGFIEESNRPALNVIKLCTAVSCDFS